jgi:hypothetical protein
MNGRFCIESILATILVCMLPRLSSAADNQQATPVGPEGTLSRSPAGQKNLSAFQAPEKRKMDKGSLHRTRDDFEKFKEEWKKLTPAERQARIREFREKSRRPLISRAEIERRREEFKHLTPEERRARIRSWREQHGGLKERLEKQIIELRQKKLDGTITPEESQRLERLEVVAQRFEQTGRSQKSSDRTIDKRDPDR